MADHKRWRGTLDGDGVHSRRDEDGNLESKSAKAIRLLREVSNFTTWDNRSAEQTCHNRSGWSNFRTILIFAPYHQSSFLTAHENSIFKVLQGQSTWVPASVIELIFQATLSTTCAATTMATLQNIANIPGRGSVPSLWFSNVGECSSLGTVKSSSGDILKSKMKILQ